MLTSDERLDNLEHPTRLSDLLEGLPPSERSSLLAILAIEAAKCENKKKLLTSLPESEVLAALEATWNVGSSSPV